MIEAALGACAEAACARGLRTGDIPHAIQDLNRALELSPDSSRYADAVSFQNSGGILHLRR
jgi:hypothetical protein